MEGRIKYPYHRRFRHQLLTSRDTDQISRIMQRCQFVTVCDSLYHFIRDQRRRCKFLTTMHNTMADCTNFGQILYDAGCFIRQRF